ncbi:MAG: ECF-type sigma factor [Thermoguttaceae bacterium]|jgi:RNA polymerase sigma factor (TIGR02999 family)
MAEVTRILAQIESGDPSAAEQLLPLVYDELRKLAAQKMAREKPGQTLEATALVHEAYIRLVDVKRVPHWDNRGHFFAAAAEAMRRILIEAARAKKSRRRGGDRHRQGLSELGAVGQANLDDYLDFDAALTRLASTDPPAAELVKLRVLGGMTLEEVAQYLGVSSHQAKRTWAYARVWLRREMQRGSPLPD